MGYIGYGLRHRHCKSGLFGNLYLADRGTHWNRRPLGTCERIRCCLRR